MNISREDYWHFNRFFCQRKLSYRLSIVICTVTFFLMGFLVCWLLELKLKAPLILIIVSAPLVGGPVVKHVFWRGKRPIMGIPWQGGDRLGEHSLGIKINSEGASAPANVSNSFTR